MLAEPFEPLAIARLADVHGSVELGAAVVGVERDVAVDPRRIRTGADPDRTLGPRARPTAARQDRRLREARERRRLVRERIGIFAAVVAPVSPRRTSRRRIRPTTRRTSSSVGGAAGLKQRAVRLAHEYTIEDERAKMAGHPTGSE
jgi:hypothetical protein